MLSSRSRSLREPNPKIFCFHKTLAINASKTNLPQTHSPNPTWDPASYELSRGFPGKSWSQWNGRFRGDVRAFVKGNPGKVGDLMSRIYGSSDLFPDDRDNAYHPYQAINYVTSHDGFCLYDLVA